MKVNFDKLNKNTELGIFRNSALLNYVRRQIEFLESHNKNYTFEQYKIIFELKEIVDCIEE